MFPRTSNISSLNNLIEFTDNFIYLTIFYIKISVYNRFEFTFDRFTLIINHSNDINILTLFFSPFRGTFVVITKCVSTLKKKSNNTWMRFAYVT